LNVQEFFLIQYFSTKPLFMTIRSFSTVLILFCSLFFTQSVRAQAYGTAVGLRIFDDIGITVQQQIAPQFTIEGIIQSRFFSTNKDVVISVLGEKHQAIMTRGLSFYWGAGGFIAPLAKRANLTQQPNTPMGLTGIAGLEVTFAKINISADFKPLIRLAGASGEIKWWQTGISVRKVIAGRYFKNEDWKFWKKKR
jgi:hypothetical protein